MPKELRQFLQLIKDQLYFSPDDYIVVLDELVWTKRGLTKFDIQQGTKFLEDKKLALKMNIHVVWKESGVPADAKGREAMLYKPFISKLGREFLLRGEKTKRQIYLKIDKSFDEFYQQTTKPKEQTVPVLKTLENIKVEFLPEKSSLMVNDKTVRIPPYKNEYDLCKTMSEYLANEPVSWDIIREEMTSAKRVGIEEDQESAQRAVYDACLAINRRVKEATDLEDLYLWEGKTVRRRY